MNPQTGNSLPARRLRVLLLSTSAVHEAMLEHTFKRTHRFAALTGGEDLAIVFLLNPPPARTFISAKQHAADFSDDTANIDAIHAYSKLQAEMMNHSEIPHMPILPLCKLDGLPQLLSKHVANLNRPPPTQKAATTSFELLKLCTANPPMSEHTSYILSDLFVNLRDLATTCSAVTSAPNSSSPSVRAAFSQADGIYDLGFGMSTQGSDVPPTGKLKRLRDLVGEQECRNVVDFWKEEWVVD